MPLTYGCSEAWATLVAILGTTISPYLFYWQTSEEVEAIQRGEFVAKEFLGAFQMRIHGRNAENFLWKLGHGVSLEHVGICRQGSLCLGPGLQQVSGQRPDAKEFRDGARGSERPGEFHQMDVLFRSM